LALILGATPSSGVKWALSILIVFFAYWYARYRGATPSSGVKCVVLAGFNYVLILLASGAALISDGVPYPRQSCIYYFKVASARVVALISGGVL